ncbi:MAG: hypothetical protein ACLRFJ_03400 [Alphaproteobacteria bacterium]
MKHLGIIAVCGIIATPAMANIASTQYVDSIKTALQASISDKMDGTFDATNSALITGTDGKVTTGSITSGMIENASVGTGQLAGSAVTNDKIATGISMAKLSLPADRCDDGTCVIVYDAANGGSFAWEAVSRVVSQ